MTHQKLAFCALLIFAFSAFQAYACSQEHSLFLNEDLDTGYIPIDERGSYFYWLFRSHNKPSQAPLVVYLTGGPGCTSENAIFTSNGPYRINKDLTLRRNPYAWNKNFNLLFVDQPFGTGFSNSETLSPSLEQIAKDFYTFMVNFLKQFPEYKNRAFYLSGESYAGHYVPALAKYILQKGGLKLNFKGVSIGGGLIDFEIQGPAWATYAYDEKLINRTAFKSAYKEIKECAQFLKDNNFEAVSDQCWYGQSIILGLGDAPAFNPYDIRLECDITGPECYDWSAIDAFFAQEKVQKLLGVEGKSFALCNGDVAGALGNDFFMDYSDDLSFLVRSKLQVLLNYGDQDWITNWIGGEEVANHLNWNKKKQFAKLKYKNWKGFGKYKKQDNLIFLKVYNAGHFLPMDLPKVALEMIEQFVHGWK